MIIHSVSGQNQRQYVCVCARVWGTYRQTYAQAYALTEINVSAWVCVHTCTYIYICIHTYTHKLSSRVLFSAVVLLFFCLFFFLNNNNAKSYSLSQRLSLVGERIGGEERDRISWKELERYANICRVNVNDELSMLWTCTYICTYTNMYICIHAHIYVRQCFLASPTHPTPPSRSAHLLVDCNYRKHSTIKEEWQKNKTEMKLFTRLLWIAYILLRECVAWMCKSTYIHMYMHMYVSNLALLNERVVVHLFAYLHSVLHIYVYMGTYVMHALGNKI